MVVFIKVLVCLKFGGGSNLDMIESNGPRFVDPTDKNCRGLNRRKQLKACGNTRRLTFADVSLRRLAYQTRHVAVPVKSLKKIDPAGEGPQPLLIPGIYTLKRSILVGRSRAKPEAKIAS